jgi:hypothetical protein
MKINYSKPKIYTGVPISQWTNSQNLKEITQQSWYVYFKFRNLKLQLTRQSNIKAGVKQLKSRAGMLEIQTQKFYFFI